MMDIEEKNLHLLKTEARVFPMTHIKPVRSSFWLWAFFVLSTVYYGYKGYWVDMPETGGELMERIGVLVIAFVLVLRPWFGKIILQGSTLTTRCRFRTLSEKVTELDDIEHIAYRFPR